MAKCSGWYYTKPMWHQDSATVVTGWSQSGSLTRGNLGKLAKTKPDAKIMLEYLKSIFTDPDRDPFGCAEPDAVYKLLTEGAELNQIFIGMTSEPRETAYGDEDKWLKPCVNCQKWLTGRLKDGNYMIDMGELNLFVKNSKLSWWSV
jgi:hypothetical protein